LSPPEDVAKFVVLALIGAWNHPPMKGCDIKRDMRRVFHTLGMCLDTGKRLFLAAELVSAFRFVLKLSNDVTNILHELMREITSRSPATRLAALFAILGGQFKPNRRHALLTISHSRGQICRGVRIDMGGCTKIVEYPVTPDTRILGDVVEHGVEPSVPFSPDIFPDVRFLVQFHDIALRNPSSIFSPFYMSAFASSIAYPDCISAIEPEVLRQIASSISGNLNPFDGIHTFVSEMCQQLAKSESVEADM
jgi:hypothetical protein